MPKNFGGGNYGSYGKLALVTWRFRWFYWEIANAMGGGGAVQTDPMSHFTSTRRGFFFGGTMIGVPWHIGKTASHEIRTGIGFAGGQAYAASGRADWDGDGDREYGNLGTEGGAFQVEAYYLFHAARYFGILFGVDLAVPFPPKEDCENCGPATPIFNGYIGFRI